MDATAGRKKAIHQTAKALHPTSFTKLKLLRAKTMRKKGRYLGAAETSLN